MIRKSNVFPMVTKLNLISNGHDDLIENVCDGAVRLIELEEMIKTKYNATQICLLKTICNDIRLALDEIEAQAIS